MGTKKSIIISFVDPTDIEVPSLLKLAMGTTSPNKIHEALTTYQLFDRCLIGCRMDGKLVGILGAKMVKGLATIQHIVVSSSYRRQGIGKLLIGELLNRFLIGFLFAETDEEAVGFYEKCDFTCKPFEGIYGKRYSCQKFHLLPSYVHI